MPDGGAVEESAWQVRPSQLPDTLRGEVFRDLPTTDHTWGVAVHRWQRGRARRLLPLGVAALTAGGVTAVGWGLAAIMAGAGAIPAWVSVGLGVVFVATFVMLWGLFAGGAALLGHLAGRVTAFALPPSAHYQATRDAFRPNSDDLGGEGEPCLVVDVGGRMRGPSVALPEHGLVWRPSVRVARQLRAVSALGALTRGAGAVPNTAGAGVAEGDALGLPDVSEWSRAVRRDAAAAAVVAGDERGPEVARAAYNAVDAAVGFADALEDRAVRTPEAVWTLTKALDECREAMTVFVSVLPDQAHVPLASGKTATQELLAVLVTVTAVCREHAGMYRVDPADRLSMLRRLNEERYGKSGLDLD